MEQTAPGRLAASIKEGTRVEVLRQVAPSDGLHC